MCKLRVLSRCFDEFKFPTDLGMPLYYHSIVGKRSHYLKPMAALKAAVRKAIRVYGTSAYIVTRAMRERIMQSSTWAATVDMSDKGRLKIYNLLLGKHEMKMADL